MIEQIHLDPSCLFVGVSCIVPNLENFKDERELQMINLVVYFSELCLRY